MNRQPFQTPPRRWPARLTPWYVSLARPLRRATLAAQKIRGPVVRGAGPVRRLLDRGAAVLLCPNHSFHYDSYVLIEASARLGRPCHFMTAWQVFATSGGLEGWSLQRHGCFSVDREANDLAALRQAIELLRDTRFPLVVFAEGDIYHTNDLVRPFREGAAAVALGAARRADRPVYAVPVALKVWYTGDPSAALGRTLDKLERRLGGPVERGRPAAERVVRAGERLVAWQERVHLGGPRPGPLAPRVAALADAVLARQEAAHDIDPAGDVAGRVQSLRRHHIRRLDDPDCPPAERDRLVDAMEELFRVVQLSSYPGDYVASRPTVERVAETVDKLEEDILDAAYPSVKGERVAVVRYGAPVPVVRGKDRAADLTAELQRRVQGMLDAMNAAGPPG